MIKCVRIEGFRLLRDFEWNPKAGTNILVGANSVGKSTVLEAIELVTRGSLNGVRAANALAPDWFNAVVVKEFFKKLEAGQTPEIPFIQITATFSDDVPAMASICGCNGPLGSKEDAPGVFMRIFVPRDLVTEFVGEANSIASTSAAKSIPVEYYECEWMSFKGQKLVRKPDCITSTRIDVKPEPFSRAVDSYARSIIESELSEAQLREVSSEIRKAHSKIDNEILSAIPIRETGKHKNLGLQLDRSPRSDWKNAIVLEREGLPFASLGSAEQILTKCAIAMERSADASILLMEEPECHLSHTSLRRLLSQIDGSLDESQQAFITTHSTYVLNRLGLDKTALMSQGSSPKSIPDLSDDTVRYFKKLSGFDTLRIILAEKAVLVEGPTDEMVFDWAFRQARGCLPIEKGIDVIEYGIRYRRAFELTAAINKEAVIALRDNDNKPESHWEEAVEQFKSPTRKLFVGSTESGHTIEPQMVRANRDRLDMLASAVHAPTSNESELEQYLLAHKVDWSLNLLEADRSITDKLKAPSYIDDAIAAIDPV